MSYSFMMMAQTSNTEGQEKQIRREKPTSTVGSSSATAPQHTEKRVESNNSEYPKTIRISSRPYYPNEQVELTREERIAELDQSISSLESKIALLESEDPVANEAEINEKKDLLEQLRKEREEFSK